MSLAKDLLEQARNLATRERGRPKQASVRRAVSAAYYALFHLLVADAARRLAHGSPPHQGLASRAFQHGTMRDVCERFAQSTAPPLLQLALAGAAIPADLKLVANAFLTLQQARHAADYDTSRPVARRESLAFVDLAQEAFEAWDRVRKEPQARLFCLCLLIWKDVRSR